MLRTVFRSSLNTTATLPSRIALRGTMYAGMRFYSNKMTADALPLTYGANPKVKYTENHEWIALHDDKVAFVGITKYAADALGDTTFVEVNSAGTACDAGESLGSVESVKSASDVYSPVSGKIIAQNDELVEDPALLNQDPMGKAWIAKIEASDASEMDKLLDLAQYESFLKDAH